ncbi:hypothetical protein [Diaminobutyricibacter sp. McL0608]|uniref:hypothetical protein n=1 Tax=Leifsonia sp. McL0608 TaxID=3143537 RepID=UPI0031F2DA4D
MPEVAEDSTPAHPTAPFRPRTRVVLLWSGIGVLLLLAFVAAIGALQRDVYSPSGFVTGYLNALVRHDARAALAMPGVDASDAALSAAGLPTAPSRELLRSDVLADISSVRIVHDDELSDGVHQVAFDAVVDGTPVSSTFRVKQTGSILGVLPLWRFSTTPLAVAAVTVEHAETFTVSGRTLDTRAADPTQPAAAFTTKADYVVFAPGIYRLAHSSMYLHADTASLLARKPGAVASVSVVAEPTSDFVSQVESQLDAFLDDCAKQTVLQPSGCPFGVVIDDRVVGAPAWSIVRYPPVNVVAGTNSWQMSPAEGIAHLQVTVQSLFDGTISTRSSDEPFSVALSSIVIRPDGALDIVVAG